MSITSAISATATPPPPIVFEKIDGSAPISSTTAKSKIVTEVTPRSFSIIETIVRFVKKIFYAIYYFIFPSQRINTDKPPQHPPLSTPSQNAAPPFLEKSDKQSELFPQKIDTSRTIDIEAPSSPKGKAETPVAEQTSPNLALSNSDKLLTASNLFQWGLVGAAALGVAPAVTGALGMAASVGSGIATYCMLPEDASFIRKAMTLPIIGKKIVEFNPIISGIVQATSLYNLVTGSASKLSQVWDGLKSNPKEALQAGAVHLFNLASGAAFAAESAGLINLRPDPVLPNKPCDPNTNMGCAGPILETHQIIPCDPSTETGCAGPKPETGVGSIVSNKQIKLATIYDNKDKTGQINIERQKISDIVVQNHRDYANKWDLDHDVVTDNLVAGECTDPSTGKAADCSPYMNKVQYFRRQCADPAQQGKLVIYGDDDLLYTNMGIDPLDAFNRLRNGKNTSVVMMREGGDWAKYFKIPGYPSTDHLPHN